MSKYFLSALLLSAMCAVSTLLPNVISKQESSYIQSAADSLKSIVGWTASKATEIAGDAAEILTEPAKNFASSMGDFAAKHPWFTMLTVGATSYYLYNSWKKGIQLKEEKRKNAGDLIEMCIEQSKNNKDTSKPLNKTSAACLKTAAQDIIGYYDWKVLNPLSWSEAVISYNNRFRVVYTAKELIKELENNIAESAIISTAQSLLVNFKQLPA